MGFPDKKELERVRKKLASVEGVKLLPKNASNADKLKFSLCKEFVVYLRIHQITQLELAQTLGNISLYFQIVNCHSSGNFTS